jgi:cytochrome c553
MRLRLIASSLLYLSSTIGAASAAVPGAKEHAAIAAYEGTKTCAACHEKQVKDVVTSLHYQQQGAALFLANAQQAKNAGMMVSY